jgi:multiple sugar transport system substrate-binding protein
MKRLMIVLLSIFLLIGALSFSALAAAPKVELNFIQQYTYVENTRLMKEIISDFEKLHPNIKINLISPPYEQATQKIVLMLSTKQPLDIVETRKGTVGLYAGNNWLFNLESYIAAWPDSKTLLPCVLPLARIVDNTAYVLPSSLALRTLYYRSDILKKLGVDSVPKTMQELFEVCKKITDPSKNQYGFNFRGKDQQVDSILVIVLSFLDDLDTNNLYRKTDGKLIFDDPRFVEGLKFYVRLFRETSPKDSINWGFNEQINAFASGITPIILQDTDFAEPCDEIIGRDKYVNVPTPVGPSGKVCMNVAFPSLGITSYSKHKEEAWEFIKYFLSPDVNAYYNKKSKKLPIHSVIFEEDPYFSSGNFSAWTYMMKHPEVYIGGLAPLGSPKYAEWVKIANDDLQSLLLGDIPIEKLVNKWMEYWQ